jgi:hypothetical protein
MASKPTLEALREQITAVIAELDTIVRAPLPVDEAEAAMGQLLDAAAARYDSQRHAVRAHPGPAAGLPLAPAARSAVGRTGGLGVLGRHRRSAPPDCAVVRAPAAGVRSRSGARHPARLGRAPRAPGRAPPAAP